MNALVGAICGIRPSSRGGGTPGAKLTYRGDRICEGDTVVGYRVTLESLATVVLVAGRVDVAPLLGIDRQPAGVTRGATARGDSVTSSPGGVTQRWPSDWQIGFLLQSASLMSAWRQGAAKPAPPAWWKELSLYQQRQDQQPGWTRGSAEDVGRKATPPSVRRSTFVTPGCAGSPDDSPRPAQRATRTKPLSDWAWRQLLGCKKRGCALPSPCLVATNRSPVAPCWTQAPLELSTEMAIIAMGKLGQKQARPLACPLFREVPWPEPRTAPWAGPRLPLRTTRPGAGRTGAAQRGQAGGLRFRRPPGTVELPFLFVGPTHVYAFDTAEQRNQGFGRCVRDFEQLGLERPPRFTPQTPTQFRFVPLGQHGAIRSSSTSPDGRVRLDLQRNTARLIEVATGKPIGEELARGFGTEAGEPSLPSIAALSAPTANTSPPVLVSMIARTRTPQQTSVVSRCGTPPRGNCCRRRFRAASKRWASRRTVRPSFFKPSGFRETSPDAVTGPPTEAGGNGWYDFARVEHALA